ncbi:MAG TPA: nodulation protein NfeD [Ignavibacteriaceae bacterium]|nr:nodulation protein NfeD [Ignavibacteriaceae bacterium]
MTKLFTSLSRAASCLSKFKYGIFSLLLFFSSQLLSAQVIVIKLDGVINPVAADFIHEQILNADKQNAECLIIELNTPGGLLKSTRLIVSDFLNSKVPLIVYVYPQGSQAASAGVFITLAAHIAAMAPGTNIGAAHPVMIGEGGNTNTKDSMDIGMEKATNDAAAFIRTIAEKRGRNINWAEKSVRQSLSLSETEALKENVINIIAKNLDELISRLEGYKVETAGGMKTIHTKDKEIKFAEMSFIQKLLDIISNPEIAYIFMMIGIYGLIFELSNPGSILPGIIGVICLVLAFYSFHTLPVNYAGFALILFSVILFIAEIKVVSHGLLAAGGIISFIIGSLMLINTDISGDFMDISLSIIITAAVLTALFFLFAVGKGIAAQKRKVSTGGEALIGESGTALSAIGTDLTGQVKLHGEIWNAECPEGEIEPGAKVVVSSLEGLNLVVKRSK